MKLQRSKLIRGIRAKNEEALASAKNLVVAVLECGVMLKALRADCPHGTWGDELKQTGVSETTARVYMKCADAAAAKGSKKVTWLIENCSSLAELLRCLGISKPCEVGAYDPDTYQRRKLAEQLEMDFSYEEFTPQLRSLIKASNVERLSPTTLQRLNEELIEAQKRVASVLADKGAINLKDHQP